MVYILANYGEKHLGFLFSSIHSIRENAPKAEIFVFWQDINSKVFDLARRVFSDVSFIRTNFDIKGNDTVRISSKTFFWHYAAEFLIDKGHTNACFMDSDTLVLKDVSHFFKQAFDIGFSVKKGIWPLNTGVMLIKLSDNSLEFLLKWRNLTVEILNNPSLYQQANSNSFFYGGADQMSLYKLLDFKPDQSQYSVHQISLKGFDSMLFNQTESRELQDCNHIIHYKGGWQRVLLEGKVFTKNRTLSDSLPQFVLFMKNYLEMRTVFGKTHGSISDLDLGIVVPAWYNAKTERVIGRLYVKKQLLTFFETYLKLTVHLLRKKRLIK